MAVEVCVMIISCLFLCCCLEKFRKQQREMGASVLLIWENVNFTTANFETFFCPEFWSRLTYSFWDISDTIQTNWMNSTSREIRRLNIKSFFNRRGLWCCYRCCWSCFLLFGQQASACTFDYLFVQLPSLSLEVCLSFVICLNIYPSAVHSIVNI